VWHGDVHEWGMVMYMSGAWWCTWVCGKMVYMSVWHGDVHECGMVMYMSVAWCTW